MPQIVTAVDIDAPAEDVFRALVDVRRYPEWNPMIKRIRGKLREGSFVFVTLDVDGLPLGFDARISRFEPNRCLAWKGPSLRALHGLVCGEHSFETIDLGGGRTRFIHSERFDGLLLQSEALWEQVEKRIAVAYPRFDEALKRYVESQRTVPVAS